VYVIFFAYETIYTALFNAFNEFGYLMWSYVIAFTVGFVPLAAWATYGNTNTSEGTYGNFTCVQSAEAEEATYHQQGDIGYTWLGNGSWDLVFAANTAVFEVVKLLSMLLFYRCKVLPKAQQEMAIRLQASERLILGKGDGTASAVNKASMKGKQFERNDRVMFASYDKYTEADVPAGEMGAVVKYVTSTNVLIEFTNGRFEVNQAELLKAPKWLSMHQQLGFTGGRGREVSDSWGHDMRGEAEEDARLTQGSNAPDYTDGEVVKRRRRPKGSHSSSKSRSPSPKRSRSDTAKADTAKGKKKKKKTRKENEKLEVAVEAQ